MGNFEKLVVLVVLFLSAIVLAVSLNQGSDAVAPGVDGGGPLDDALARAGAEPLDADRGGAEGRSADQAPIRFPEPPAAGGASAEGGGEPRSESTALLDSSVGDAEGEPERDARGRLRILREGVRGVSRSPDDDLRFYACADGDTWEEVATKLYGDERYVALLRLCNEGVSELGGGETILVPVYDFAAESVERPRVVRPAPEEPLRRYTVKAGDSLSVISQRVYGTSTRWNEIFEANRDVLSDPDVVAEGTVLRIPNGPPLQRRP